jgi:hypothetical protein
MPRFSNCLFPTGFQYKNPVRSIETASPFTRTLQSHLQLPSQNGIMNRTFHLAQPSAHWLKLHMKEEVPSLSHSRLLIHNTSVYFVNQQHTFNRFFFPSG